VVTLIGFSWLVRELATLRKPKDRTRVMTAMTTEVAAAE